MSFDLGVAATERGEHGEGEQFAGGHVDAGAGQVVAEAVGRQVTLQMLLVIGRGGVHGVDPLAADDLLLHGQPAVEPGRWGRCRLAGQRQRHPAFGEDVVGGVQEVKHLGHADVGNGLVDDLFQLHRRQSGGQCGAGHDPELGHGLARDDRSQLHHEPAADVEVAVGEHLVEGEVVEALDEFRVGLGQGRFPVREQFVVVAAGCLADGHGVLVLFRRR